jgi:hypothetical protein
MNGISRALWRRRQDRALVRGIAAFAVLFLAASLVAVLFDP